MNIKYDIQKLEKIINGLSILTGISINFCDTDGNTLIRTTKRGDFCSAVQELEDNIKKCRRSDADILEKCKQSQQLEYHICYTGLCDMAMPIYKQDTLVGYVIMGRLRTSQTPAYDANPYTQAHPSEVLHLLYKKAPYFTQEKIDCLKELLPQILFENAIEIEVNHFIEQILEYITLHLHEELTIASLCKKFHISKNSLYEAFHSTLNCTVNEYISDQRIKKAKLLLTKTQEPVYRIAEMVGIENYTYFCKLFKRKEGISPTAYRKRTDTKP